MKLIKNANLKEYNSYKLGGFAKSMIIIESIDELDSLDKTILKNAEVIGEGTNILVSDKGVDGNVIKIAFKGHEIGGDKVITQAGTNLTKMAVELVKQGYKAFFFAVGIPGTVGGAVVMNAGTDKCIADVLESIRIMTRAGKRKTLLVSELEYGHRNSILQSKDWIVLSATFKAEKGEPIAQEQIDKKLNGRAKKQPLTFPSAGCWFKGAWGGNGIIKEIGMVGKWIGGAVSSPLFPAFILNVDATAQDVYSLAKEIQDKAKKIGKSLPFEIKLIGDFINSLK